MTAQQAGARRRGDGPAGTLKWLSRGTCGFILCRGMMPKWLKTESVKKKKKALPGGARSLGKGNRVLENDFVMTWLGDYEHLYNLKVKVGNGK